MQAVKAFAEASPHGFLRMNGSASHSPTHEETSCLREHYRTHDAGPGADPHATLMQELVNGPRSMALLLTLDQKVGVVQTTKDKAKFERGRTLCRPTSHIHLASALSRVAKGNG